jgi:hypothetical protein
MTSTVVTETITSEDGNTTTRQTTTSSNYLERRQKMRDIETARVRGWGYFLGAYLTGPIWPGMVANRTGEWTPFWVGLGLGVCSLPFVFLDLGVVSSLPAAGVGTAMMAQKSKEKRRMLDVISPEQADMMLFSKDL